MLTDLLLEEKFFAVLTGLDAEIAEKVASSGCRHCGGPLYQANYERKPRGAQIAVVREAFSMRHSLCCGRKGCRRRALPPSLRFLGTTVYIGAVVLLASVAAQLLSVLRDARAATGVPGRTLRRWGLWWRDTFPQSSTWTELRARFAPPPPDEIALPNSCSRVSVLTLSSSIALRQSRTSASSLLDCWRPRPRCRCPMDHVS